MSRILQLTALISAAVFFAAVIGLILIHLSQPSYKPGEQQTTTETPNSKKETKEWESFGQRIIRDPVALFTFLLVIANFLLAFSAIIQIRLLARSEHIAKNAANAANKSAEVAEKTLIATQRPWVSVHTGIASGFKFSGQEARITIRFSMKNIGNSPAVGTWVEAMIYLSSPKRDMIIEQRKVCATAQEKKVDPSNPSLGYILFPNESFTQDISLPISRQDIDQNRTEFAESFKDVPPDNLIAPVLVGCVRYRFAFDGSIHKTGFIAQIHRLDPQYPKGRFAIDITAGDIPAERLTLETFFTGSFAD